MFHDINLANGTSTIVPIPPSPVLAIWGYLAVVVCGLSFGSASLPIKKFEAGNFVILKRSKNFYTFFCKGDGVTFSLVSALALWSVGLIVHCIRDFPTFYFLPMLGGFFFAAANAKMVPILKTIGIGMGTSIRASIGIVVGWVNVCNRSIFSLNNSFKKSYLKRHVMVYLAR